MTVPPATPLLELRGITKHFPGVVALGAVDLSVGRGEVVGLIGENGAGKSTLMKILGGVQSPDGGQIFFDGQPVVLRGVADALALGIGFIHQELNVLENLDVGANIFLGREPRRGGPLCLLDRRRIDADSAALLARLGLNVSPRQPLGELSLAQQQTVEIAKALSLDARLLIMDEPTSSLTLTETERLLTTVEDLRRAGVSVIYISHRLAEIERVADRVVALRDGCNAGELPRGEINHGRMVSLMVGRSLESMYVQGQAVRREGRFEVRGLRTRYRPGQRVSFAVAGGEILGLAGLVGAGRSEIAEAIFGVEPALEGKILLDGEELVIRRPRDAIDAGIYLAPEDRRRTGLVTDLSVRENVTLPGLARYTRGGLIRRRRETVVAQREVESLRIKTPGVETRVGNLSGGNQQKVVLAKWLSLDPKLLIFDEPTRGIDIGARAEIYRLMRALAERGVAILMISSDLEEILGVSDRVAVLHEGELAGFLPRAECSEEAIMRLAVGRQTA